MTTMNRAHRYFANIVELARDRGLIGNILRDYPEWIWRATDKSAEQDAEYQTKHGDQKRLPLPDPWRFLLGMRDVPDSHKAVFLAAQSQLVALRHLGRMRMGIATLETDWQQEAIQARNAGDGARSNHAANKVANGLWQFEPVVETVKNKAEDRPELLIDALAWQKRRRAQLVHRGEWGGSQTKRWPSYSGFRDQNKLPVLLVEWWVRQGANGAPGFMFWRNEAITHLLQLRLRLPPTALPPAEIKKIRQRLGLIPVSKDNHFVWSIRDKVSAAGNRTIEGVQRNGAFAFSGEIPPK
jgi:hypothetical protein